MALFSRSLKERLTIPARHADAANIALILFACALAHVFPYYLLLFSYAVLGPAHYLTQISWLHDRRYFASSAALAPVMALFSLLLVAIVFATGGLAAVIPMAVVLNAAVFLALFAVLPLRKQRLFAAAAGVFVTVLLFFSPLAAMCLVLLLPSVLHVFVFTGCFMLAGALKSGKPAAWGAFAALLFAAVTFLLPADVLPGAGFAEGDFIGGGDLQGIAYFQPVAVLLQRLGFSGASETQLFGFLSFAYTYHYLNWFSKAEVIHWDKVPRRRMAAIAVIYAVVLAVYAYSFTAGLLFVLALSYAHVLLEFPLNFRTFAAIARGKG